MRSSERRRSCSPSSEPWTPGSRLTSSDAKEIQAFRKDFKRKGSFVRVVVSHGDKAKSFEEGVSVLSWGGWFSNRDRDRSIVFLRRGELLVADVALCKRPPGARRPLLLFTQSKTSCTPRSEYTVDLFRARFGNHPSPRQREDVFFERTCFATMQHYPSHEGCFALQIFPEGLNPRRVARCHLTACLDLQRNQLACLFQNEIHLMPSAITSVVYFALLWIERAPCLQGLKQGLFQPESRVHAGC